MESNIDNLVKNILEAGRFTVCTKVASVEPHTVSMALSEGRKVIINPTGAYDIFEDSSGRGMLHLKDGQPLHYASKDWKIKKAGKEYGLSIPDDIPIENYVRLGDGSIRQFDLARYESIRAHKKVIKPRIERKKIIEERFLLFFKNRREEVEVVQEEEAIYEQNPTGEYTIGEKLEEQRHFPYELLNPAFGGKEEGTYLFESEQLRESVSGGRPYTHTEWIYLPQTLAEETIENLMGRKITYAELFDRIFPHWRKIKND